MPTLAAIALGSNLGDRQAHLDGAMAALAATDGLELVAVSQFHATAPAGGPGGQGLFLNAAALVATDLAPAPLLHRLQDLETAAGRVRTTRWGERVLDLDLVLHGSSVLASPSLQVPHPRLAVRRFVLAPLAEIAADQLEPITGRTIRSLLANLDRRPCSLTLVERPGRRDLSATPPSTSTRHLLARLRLALDADTDADTEDRWRIGILRDAPLTPEWHDPPTFAVALITDRGPDGWLATAQGSPPPIRRETPILWVDAWDSEAALAEILAACQASRPG